MLCNISEIFNHQIAVYCIKNILIALNEDNFNY
jgi:hypothetical protein